MPLTHTWSTLSKPQLGRYAEFLVKMELSMHGLDVYTAEVDDKGIDFIVRRDSNTYFDIQVKSSRNYTYIFFPKRCFSPRPNLYAAFVHFLDGSLPGLYLIPSLEWCQPNKLLVDREYEGKKSLPEYGINVSRINMPLLEKYSFNLSVEQLKLRPAV
jgi:hypothetical protein